MAFHGRERRSSVDGRGEGLAIPYVERPVRHPSSFMGAREIPAGASRTRIHVLGSRALLPPVPKCIGNDFRSPSVGIPCFLLEYGPVRGAAVGLGSGPSPGPGSSSKERGRGSVARTHPRTVTAASARAFRNLRGPWPSRADPGTTRVARTSTGRGDMCDSPSDAIMAGWHHSAPWGYASDDRHRARFNVERARVDVACARPMPEPLPKTQGDGLGRRVHRRHQRTKSRGGPVAMRRA